MRRKPGPDWAWVTGAPPRQPPEERPTAWAGLWPPGAQMPARTYHLVALGAVPDGVLHAGDGREEPAHHRVPGEGRLMWSECKTRRASPGHARPPPATATGGELGLEPLRRGFSAPLPTPLEASQAGMSNRGAGGAEVSRRAASGDPLQRPTATATVPPSRQLPVEADCGAFTPETSCRGTGPRARLTH